MAWAHAGQYGPEDLRRWNSGTQQLTYPSTVQVNQYGLATLAQLYTTLTRTAVSQNPVALNVTPNLPGVDTNGNLLFYAEPGIYDLKIDGTTYTVHVPPHALDLAALSSGSFQAF